MTSRRYKYCLVPMCTNTTVKTPEKIFLDVPRCYSERKKWCLAMKRDVKNSPLSERSVRHVCQDHFDFDNDIENYMQYRLQGMRPKLKKGTVPHIFACQKPQVYTVSTERAARAAKRQRKQIVSDLLAKHEYDQSSTIPLENSASVADVPLNFFERCVKVIQERFKVPSCSEATVITTDSIKKAELGHTFNPDLHEVACEFSDGKIKTEEIYSNCDSVSTTSGSEFYKYDERSGDAANSGFSHVIIKAEEICFSCDSESSTSGSNSYKYDERPGEVASRFSDVKIKAEGIYTNCDSVPVTSDSESYKYDERPGEIANSGFSDVKIKAEEICSSCDSESVTSGSESYKCDESSGEVTSGFSEVKLKAEEIYSSCDSESVSSDSESFKYLISMMKD